MPQPSILVVGSTMIDLIAYAERLPEAGETLVGTGFRSGFGGKGANQAVAAARFGARVALVNTVGDDAYGGETIATSVNASRRVCSYWSTRKEMGRVCDRLHDGR